MKARIRKRYGTMIADPPWPERGGGRITRGAQRHYRLMRVPEIITLMQERVATLMRFDSHLYLWVTNNYLPAGLEVIKACDYRYITTITWMKDSIKLGQYYRGMTEHCLFAVRGRPGYRYLPNGKRAQGRTGFTAPRIREHSRKPDQIHRWAEIVSPGPYIELFARSRRPGWDAWGDEV